MQHSVFREIKDNLQLSMPLMASWIIYSLGPFVGTAMLAHLGKDVLAASVLVATIWSAGIVFWFGVFHSVSVLISQRRGANDYAGISDIMAQALLLNIFSWVPMMLLMASVPFLVQWSAPNQQVLLYATQYSHAIMLAVPGLISLGILEHFLSGIGKTGMSLCISLIEIPIEIVFIYIFIFGKLGIPAFGIAGVGYGLALSYTLTTLVVFTYLFYAKFAKPYQIFKKLGQFNFLYCKEMLRIGVPVGFTYFIELVAFTIATYLISIFHTTALAAHQIIMQFDSVFINIPYAVAQAISIRVGLNVGRQDKLGVMYASYVGMGVGIFAALLIFLILLLLPMILLRIDLNTVEMQNHEFVKLTISLFVILAVYQVVDTIRILAAGALRGVKDTHSTMMVNIVCFFMLGIMFAYVIGIHFAVGVRGVWYGLTLGMILSALVLVFRLRRVLRQMDMVKF